MNFAPEKCKHAQNCIHIVYSKRKATGFPYTFTMHVNEPQTSLKRT